MRNNKTVKVYGIKDKRRSVASLTKVRLKEKYIQWMQNTMAFYLKEICLYAKNPPRMLKTLRAGGCLP